MGFLFRKRIRILPGISLNISKHGARLHDSYFGNAYSVVQRGMTYGPFTRSLYHSTHNGLQRWKWLLLAVMAGTVLLLL